MIHNASDTKIFWTVTKSSSIWKHDIVLSTYA